MENGQRERKYPVSGSCVGRKALLPDNQIKVLPVPSAAGQCGPPSGSHQAKWPRCRGRGRRGRALGSIEGEWAA